MLNPFLSSHIPELLQGINTRAIIQYIQPFSTVSLPAMSSATGIAETHLLAQLEDLIEQKKVKGKIDLIDMVSSDQKCTRFRAELPGLAYSRFRSSR
jgi:hypothetical protein